MSTVGVTSRGQTMSYAVNEGVLELALYRSPCNEIGSLSLDELESFSRALEELEPQLHAVIIHSEMKAGSCAGADWRELYQRSQAMENEDAMRGVREFLERIHRVLNAVDASPLTSIAAVHGVTFGGGLELALACDLIIADKTARFAFPELRLGLIPGFGGIPRLKRDVGNAVVRDLLLTGRSFNSTKAQTLGLVSQMVAQGKHVDVARATARQATRFDPDAAATCKAFMKPVPYAELEAEKQHFKRLVLRPQVEAALKKFVESTDLRPYLP